MSHLLPVFLLEQQLNATPDSRFSRSVYRGLLQKKVRFETYLPVGTFPRGWYVYMIFHDIYTDFYTVSEVGWTRFTHQNDREILLYMLVGPKMWIIEVNATIVPGKPMKRTNPWETYLPVGTFRNELSFATNPWGLFYKIGFRLKP